MSYPEYVEARDVRFTRMQLRPGDGPPTLDVAGFVFHSALAVKGVQVTRHEGQRQVLVALTPVGRGGDGNFAVEVVLDRPDEPVVFGPAAAPIWPPQQAPQQASQQGAR